MFFKNKSILTYSLVISYLLRSLIKIVFSVWTITLNKVSSLKQTETTARRCLDLVRLVQTDEDKKALLDKINSRRNKVAAGELRSYPAAANMMKLVSDYK